MSISYRFGDVDVHVARSRARAASLEADDQAMVRDVVGATGVRRAAGWRRGAGEDHRLQGGRYRRRHRLEPGLAAVRPRLDRKSAGRYTSRAPTYRARCCAIKKMDVDQDCFSVHWGY